ncbi:MAG: hypothetical protein GX025_07170 [Clostridiales bacterium]|nr:hypothetical protein [Clostridiales bacterium]
MDEEILKQREIKDVRERQEQAPAQLEHLQPLQSWGGAQGEQLQRQKESFAENIMEYQTAYGQAAIGQMGRQARRIRVTSSANVSGPLTAQPVASESYKARRERQKKLKAARKVCPVGDENTMEIAAQIRASIDCRTAVIDDEVRGLVEKSGSDPRILRAFCQDYNLDRKGKPASAIDEYIQKENGSFMREYASGDPLLRRPHLDRIKTEMISWTFSMKPDMFTPENLIRRAAEYKAMADKFTYFENLQKENPEYFEQLPQLEQEVLEEQSRLGVAFTHAFSMHMNALGINFNVGKVYGYDSKVPIELGLNMRDDATANYSSKLRSYGSGVKNLFANEVERLVAAENSLELEREFAEQDELLSQKFGVSFPNGGTPLLYEDFAKYRNMILENPEAYQRNRELIDKVFSDFFKTQSSRSERFLYRLKLQRVQNNNSINPTEDPIKTWLTHQASILLDKCSKEDNLMEHYAGALMDIMAHLLLGKPLSNPAESALQRYKAASAEEE